MSYYYQSANYQKFFSSYWSKLNQYFLHTQYIEVGIGKLVSMFVTDIALNDL